MGYHTEYAIQFYGEENRVKELKENLLRKYGDLNLRSLLADGSCYAKLYDIDEWITEIAIQYPDILIILSGAGKSSDDMWEARWRGDVHEFHSPFTDDRLIIPNRTK